MVKHNYYLVIKYRVGKTLIIKKTADIQEVLWLDLQIMNGLIVLDAIENSQED